MRPTARTEQSWTLGALLDWTARHLAQKNVEHPRLDAEVLLAHAAGCKRIDLYGVRHGDEATTDVRQTYRDLIRRRLEGCPVAYLVGRKEFYGLELNVSPAVLIPRPDSEHVVMECVAHAKTRTGPAILDVGTGSGNLALAIAKHLPTARVTTIDLSPDALEVARGNAAKLNLADRVRFLQGDLFAPLAEDERFDVIVSNPPYIAAADMPSLPIGVRQYEPHLALNGGPDGFAVFDRLIDQARRHLIPNGLLIVEIGAPQEEPARARLTTLPEYHLMPTIRDYSGHPRVLRAEYRP